MLYIDSLQSDMDYKASSQHSKQSSMDADDTHAETFEAEGKPDIDHFILNNTYVDSCLLIDYTGSHDMK